MNYANLAYLYVQCIHTMILVFSSFSKYWSLNMWTEPSTTILPFPYCKSKGICEKHYAIYRLSMHPDICQIQACAIFNSQLYVSFASRGLCCSPKWFTVMFGLCPSHGCRRINWNWTQVKLNSSLSGTNNSGANISLCSYWAFWCQN